MFKAVATFVGKSATVSRWRGAVLLFIPVAWCVASHFGALTFLENKSLDWRFKVRGEIDSPPAVVYVDIDSQSLSEIGGFPWSRMYFARVAAALIAHAGVKAVGIDVVFSENGVAEAIDWKKRVAGNRELAGYLAKDPPVVIAASYAAAVDRDINGQIVHRALPRRDDRSPNATTDLPELPVFRISENDASQQWSPVLIGLIDTVDGNTRAVPAFAPTSARNFLHLSIELARLYYEVPPDGVRISDSQIDLMRADGTRAVRIPMTKSQHLEVNWFSAWDSPRNLRVSLSTVFNYATMLESSDPAERRAAAAFFGQPDFKGALVLIGPVDPLLQDLAVTPLDDIPVPKVGVHGNLLKMILTGKFLWKPPEIGGAAWIDFALAMGLTGVVGGLATSAGGRSRTKKLGAAAVLCAYAGFAFWIFGRHQVLLPVALPLLAALTTTFAAVTWQLLREEQQKSRIKGMFGTYVSPQLVDRMIESGETPQLGGHDSEITAYFSDIQAFSAFSEKLRSGPLVELMNEYLTACTDILQEEGGTLDKYIGDAVVAMFGAPIALPDHALRACVASQRIHRRIAELRAKWKSEGDRWPEIVWGMQSRIGLNTGIATIGNMGSRTRFNYTMMGDNVNLAARMESGAKAFGVYTMVSQWTKAACEQHGGDRLVFRFLDRIVVKGRSQPISVYEIVGLKEHVGDGAFACVQSFETGMRHYLAMEWSEAISTFRQSAALEPNQPSESAAVASTAINPSVVMLQRCERLRSAPPAHGWDGVYVMTEK